MAKKLGFVLKDPRDLMAGDVLFMDDKNMIIIDVLSDDLFVISPRFERNGDDCSSIGKSPSSSAI